MKIMKACTYFHCCCLVAQLSVQRSTSIMRMSHCKTVSTVTRHDEALTSDPEATKAALVPPKQERMMKRGCLFGSMRYSIAGSFTAREASSAPHRRPKHGSGSAGMSTFKLVHLYPMCLIHHPTLTRFGFFAAFCMLSICPSLALLLQTLHIIEAGKHATPVLLCGELQAHNMLSACMSGQWRELAARIQSRLMLDADPADLMPEHIYNAWYLVLQAPM